MRAMQAIILVALVACSSAPEAPAVDQAATPTADAIVKVIDRGPAKVTLTVWPPKPTLTAYSGRSISHGLPKRSHSSARSTWDPLRMACSKMPNS